MGYKEIYNEWLTNAYFDADTKAELERIASDENEIKERFYTDLGFDSVRSQAACRFLCKFR